MADHGATETLIVAMHTEGGEPSSAPPLTTMVRTSGIDYSLDDTDTAEPRRTDDEAVTLPIPSSGLLTSSAQTGCDNAGPAWSGGATSTTESRFSLATLLHRRGSGSAGRAASCTSTDGAVLLTGSPMQWPNPPHVIREFGHVPSRACSSGGIQIPSHRHGTCGTLAMSGMMSATSAVEESDEALVDLACSECSDGRARRHSIQEQQDREHAAPQSAHVTQHLQLQDLESVAEVLATESDGDEVFSCSTADRCHSGDVTIDDEDDDDVDADDLGQDMAEPSESSPRRDAGAAGGDASIIAEDASCCGDDCSGGGGAASGEEGSRWLTAEDYAVTDAITQLQAVVSGLSEPYQRYIRARALELTRIIDENLQRQGLEPHVGGGGVGMATPSKKAATAAAALVLAVAASGTRWPYSTAASGVGGGAEPTAPAASGGIQWLFRSSDFVGNASVAASGASLPYCGPSGGGSAHPLLGAQAADLSYGGSATSGSCTLCFGSVLGNSQARPIDSVDHTSSAFSARAAAPAQHASSSRRRTSGSYLSFYAQQQSHRRLAGLRLNGAFESASAMSSACSNPYHAIQPASQAPDTSRRPSAGRRMPPRPPPRGLGCGLGQPRKAANDASNTEPCVDNPLYLAMPYLEPAALLGTARDHYLPGFPAMEHYTSTASAREHYTVTSSAREHYSSTVSAREHYNPGASFRRPRLSSQHLDQQQLHDQEEPLGFGEPTKLLATQQLEAAALRRATGRPSSGNAAAAVSRRIGNSANGQVAKNAPGRRGGIPPASLAPANYQAPWQRPPPSARGNGPGNDRQRAADGAGTEPQPKNRRGPPKAVPAKGSAIPPTQAATQTNRGAARKPTGQQLRPGCPEYDDDITVKSAREASGSGGAGCSYQELLRKSGGSRASMTSIARGTGGPTGMAAAAAPPPSMHPDVPQRPHVGCNSYPINTSSELTSAGGTSSERLTDRAVPSDADGAPAAVTATAAAETSPTPRPRAPCIADGGDDGDDNEDVLATAFDGTGTWDSVLQSELPYHLVQTFPPLSRDEARGAGAGGSTPLGQRPLEWQPLQTALTLGELQALARQPGGRDTSAPGTLRAPLPLRPHLQNQLRPTTGSRNPGSTGGRGPSSGAAPYNPDDDNEPATAFAIISRCGTREPASDRARSSTAATSSFGDLSSLLPAPAWRQGTVSEPPAEGRVAPNTVAATNTAAVSGAGGQRQLPHEGMDNMASVGGRLRRENGIPPDQCSRARDPYLLAAIARDPAFVGMVDGAERGGSAAAQLRSVLASMGGAQLAGGSGQGRRWKLDAARLMVPDKEQIRASSPVRPRYALGNSDSHASPPAVPRHQQRGQQRRREAVQRRDGSSGRGMKAARGAAAAATGTARQKTAVSKRTNAGALGATGRSTGGLKSRTTPLRRAGKALRARGQPAGGRPPPAPPPPAPLLQQQSQQQQRRRPVTPVMPSSPPPPQQSQTPVQLQQPQGAGGGCVRRWSDEDDDDEDPEDPDPSQGTGASEPESDGSPTTPTRRRLHIHSPEDMPLSVAARQSSQQQQRVGLETTRTTFVGGSSASLSSAAKVALGGAVTARTLPTTAPAAWGTATNGSCVNSQSQRHRPGPSAYSPRLQGVSYAPVPAHRWAAGRTYTTTSIHNDGTTTTTTTVVNSTGISRGAWHHDCTPNILSPPRNYDRPWTTPSQRNSHDPCANDVESSSVYAAPMCPGSSGPASGAHGDGDSSIVSSPTIGGGRRGARPMLGRGCSPHSGQLQHPVSGGSRQRGPHAEEIGDGESTGMASGGRCNALAINAAAGFAAPLGSAEESGARSNNTLPVSSRVAGVYSAAPGLSNHRVAGDRVAPGPGGSGGHGVQETARAVSIGHVGLAMVHHEPHSGGVHQLSATGVAVMAVGGPASGGHAPGNGIVVPDAASALTSAGTSSAAGSAACLGGMEGSPGLQGAPLLDTKAEAVQTDTLDATADGSAVLNRMGRSGNECSRKASSPSGLITARHDGGGRGYSVNGGRGSGRPPIGAFRPSAGLRAAPAGTGGAQLALLHQAAWPGLRDPRVVDALSTLEAGIAVLDPVPPPPASSLGIQELNEVGSGGGSSAPNGCFGLFNRNAMAATKTPVVLVQDPAGQRPILLRVHVADGAVELVLLRPRRGGSVATHHGVTSQPTVSATSTGEQRVRVAALSGLHPPLINAQSPTTGAGLLDDLADPSSRWVQLVAMDGGLLRLSACTPADHARLVLGLNAGLLAAMGAIGEETPLSVVPLCRGLGGAP